MAYSPAFFAGQLAYADKLIQRFDADPSEFLFKYTAIGRNLNLEPTLTTKQSGTLPVKRLSSDVRSRVDGLVGV